MNKINKTRIRKFASFIYRALNCKEKNTKPLTVKQLNSIIMIYELYERSLKELSLQSTPLLWRKGKRK